MIRAGTQFDPIVVVDRYAEEEGSAVREAMLAALPPEEPVQWLLDPMQAYLGRPAKLLRPLLCIATGRILGSHDSEVLPLAAAIELLHNQFLIQDDLADESTSRRGAPTLHLDVGPALALTASVGLGLHALRLLHDSNRWLGPRLADQVTHEFMSMLRRTLQGQATELGWIRDKVTDLEPHHYLEMVALKTCWYTTIHPLRIGALVATAGAVDLDRFVQLGLHLGTAFQIQDDLLNLEGEFHAYGKEHAGDLREGKRTLMLIHLLRTATGDDRRFMDRYLSMSQAERNPEVLAKVLELMERYDSLAFARAYSSRIADEAERAFERLFVGAPPSRDLDFISALVPYMIRRRR